MAKRKTTTQYREWSLKELEEVRSLHDDYGLTFNEIGLKMGIPPRKCRGAYHTGRTRDYITIGTLCEENGISQRLFNAVRDERRDRRLPHKPHDVVRACLQAVGREDG